jgi:hypothetical protein
MIEKLLMIPYAKVVAIGIIVVALTASHWKAYVAGENHIKAENALEMVVAVDRAVKETKDLQSESDKRYADTIGKLQKLNTDANRIIVELRSRPSRSTAIPATTSCPTTSCTGASLYSEDGTFLIRETTRADRVIEYWIQCQDQYNSVRDRLNKVEK